MRISLEEQIARANARLKETKEHICLLDLLSMLNIDKDMKIELEESKESNRFYLPKYRFYTKEYKYATKVKLYEIKDNTDTWNYTLDFRIDFSFDFSPPQRNYPPIEIHCREPGWEDNEKHMLVKLDINKRGNEIFHIIHGPKKTKEIIALYKKLGVESKLLKKAEGIIKQVRKKWPKAK